MKIKTDELTDDALDRAVALASGWAKSQLRNLMRHPVKFSSDWAHGGPIIEREEISIERITSALWIATRKEGAAVSESDGPTPLVAAMRCYVASQLGDEVEIPNELIQPQT